MSLRDRWEFEFTASKLAEGATAKKSHHEDRLKFWEESKAKVMADVKEGGIEVNESMANQYSNKSASFEPQVMVRNDLQTRLTECHRKLQEHSGKVREYDGWIQVLKGNPESRMKLNSDDYLYFFGTYQ